MDEGPLDEPQEGHYEMVMPLVACKDHGGPYEGRDFVAGYEASNLDSIMRTLDALYTVGLYEATIRRYVAPGLLPQIDLLAMKHGFTATSEPWDEHPDEWACVTLTRCLVPDDDPDGAPDV